MPKPPPPTGGLTRIGSAAAAPSTPTVEVPKEVRSHRLFNDLADADLAYLMSLAQIDDYGKRATVFEQGAPCNGLYVVLSGTVRLFKASPDGREHVVEVIRQGQSFAEAAVFADVPGFPVHAQTLGPCRLMFLPKAPYLDFLRDHPSYLFAMVAGLSIRMHQLVVKMERLTLKDALQRTAGHLLDMAGDGGSATLDVTKATLASQLGLTPETLSRALTALQEQELLHMTGSEFTLPDRDGLQALSKGSA